jgi:hypothetical protein
MDAADRRWLAARERVYREEYDEAVCLLHEAEKRFHFTKHLNLLAELYVINKV